MALIRSVRTPHVIQSGPGIRGGVAHRRFSPAVSESTVIEPENICAGVFPDRSKLANPQAQIPARPAEPHPGQVSATVPGDKPALQPVAAFRLTPRLFEFQSQVRRLGLAYRLGLKEQPAFHDVHEHGSTSLRTKC